MPAWKDKAVAILGEATSLWARVSVPRKRAEIAAHTEVRLETLDQRMRALEQEAEASFDVVRAIAQQHSSLTEQHVELVQAAEAADKKIERLAWLCAALGLLAAIALLVALLK